MRLITKQIGLLPLIAAALLLVSCGASHQVHDESIDKDADFGFEKLRGKGLLIAGVSSQRVPLPSKERVKLGSIISNMLLENLKGASAIRVSGTIMLVNHMGIDAYDDLMLECDREGFLTFDRIRELASLDENNEYILLAHIVNENVADYSYEKTRNDNTIETEYEKQYFMSVDFQLYDVKHTKMVWSNVIYNESERTESRTSETGCVESCVSALIQTILFGSPAEISREEVMEAIVERCVVNLLKAKGS